MKSDHALNDLLHVAKMPRSSFYYKEIKRNYHEVKETILSLYKKNRKRDGYRPVTFKLRQMGNGCNGISCWARKALFFTVDGLG